MFAVSCSYIFLRWILCKYENLIENSATSSIKSRFVWIAYSILSVILLSVSVSPDRIKMNTYPKRCNNRLIESINFHRLNNEHLIISVLYMLTCLHYELYGCDEARTLSRKSLSTKIFSTQSLTHTNLNNSIKIHPECVSWLDWEP